MRRLTSRDVDVLACAQAKVLGGLYLGCSSVDIVAGADDRSALGIDLGACLLATAKEQMVLGSQVMRLSVEMLSVERLTSLPALMRVTPFSTAFVI